MNEKNTSFKYKMASGLVWRFGERITAQLVSTIVSIVLARLLSPDNYGIISLTLVFINLANVFVTSSFGNALVQKKNVDNLDFSSVFYFNIVFSLGLYAALFLAAPGLAGFYENPLLTPVIRVLAVRIPVAAINSIQQAYVSRNMLFKRFFWSTLFGTVISGVVGIIMAYHGFGVWALVAQYLTNTCTDTIVLWFTVKWRPDFAFSWKRARGLISYGWKLLVSALLETGYNELRALIIGKLYSTSDLAYYKQGDKYPNLIVVNVNTSISSVLFPAISQVQDEQMRVKQMTRRAIQISSYIMWPMMLGLGVVAEPFIRIVLTEKWLPCVPFLRIFCFTYGLWPIHTANLEAIKAMGRSDLYLKLEVIKKALGILALVISMRFGVLAIAWSLVATGIISTFVNSAPNKKMLNYSYLEQLCDILPSFAMAVVMAVIIYPISWLGMPDIVTIIVQIFCGCLIYLILSILTKQSAFSYLLSFIKKSK